MTEFLGLGIPARAIKWFACWGTSMELRRFGGLVEETMSTVRPFGDAAIWINVGLRS